MAEYLARLPAIPRRRLQLVRKLGKSAAPGCIDAISYGIPALRHGRTFCYYAAFKDHVSIFPPVRGRDALARALRPYRNAKGNLLFPHAGPFPQALIAKVVKALAVQGQSRPPRSAGRGKKRAAAKPRG